MQRVQKRARWSISIPLLLPVPVSRTSTRNLPLDGDRGRAVIEQRMAFQEVMRQRFEAVVQHATGRAVIGFMSGNQQDPDLICEVFVLSPTDLFDEAELRAAAESRTTVTEAEIGSRG